MGLLYGAGQRSAIKRLQGYLSDCPELIHTIENKIIPKDETLEIALFYENTCGK